MLIFSLSYAVRGEGCFIAYFDAWFVDELGERQRWRLFKYLRCHTTVSTLASFKRIQIAFRVCLDFDVGFRRTQVKWKVRTKVDLFGSFGSL
jgi:hypothetical protein